MRFKFPKLGTLTTECTGDYDRDGRAQWRVTFREWGKRKPCLAFTVGQPVIGLYGDTERDVEYKIASSAISFISEPSAWDDPSEREVCERIGEDLSNAAFCRADTLGKLVRGGC